MPKIIYVRMQFYLENVVFLNVFIVPDINVVHHWRRAGDAFNFDNFVQTDLEVRDDRDEDGELDCGPGCGVDTESHVVRATATGKRTQPLLIAECPGHVGVGQPPAVIDQVVAQTEKNRALTGGGKAGLYFDRADCLGFQGSQLGLNCFLAETTADGLEM